MAEAETGGGAKSLLDLSPLGAFLVGLFLGAGILVVYHAYTHKAWVNELAKAHVENQVLQKSKAEAMAEIVKLRANSPK